MEEKVNKEFISREDSELVLLTIYNSLRYKSLFGRPVNMYLILSNEQTLMPILQINAIDDNDNEYMIEVEARKRGDSIVNGYTAKVIVNAEDPFNCREFEEKWKFDASLMSNEQDAVANELYDKLIELMDVKTR